MTNFIKKYTAFIFKHGREPIFSDEDIETRRLYFWKIEQMSKWKKNRLPIQYVKFWEKLCYYKEIPQKTKQIPKAEINKKNNNHKLEQQCKRLIEFIVINEALPSLTSKDQQEKELRIWYHFLSIKKRKTKFEKQIYNKIEEVIHNLFYYNLK